MEPIFSADHVAKFFNIFSKNEITKVYSMAYVYQDIQYVIKYNNIRV